MQCALWIYVRHHCKNVAVTLKSSMWLTLNSTWHALLHNTCACRLSHFSCVQLFTTLWTVACQAFLSMEFSRREYWSALPCLPPGDLPDPGIEPTSPSASALQAGSLPPSHWEAHMPMTATNTNLDLINMSLILHNSPQNLAIKLFSNSYLFLTSECTYQRVNYALLENKWKFFNYLKFMKF